MNRNDCHAFTTAILLLIFMPPFLHGLTACANDIQPLKPPISLPFAVQKAGSKAGAEVRIIERQTYAFELQYFHKENDQDDRANTWNLAGGSLKDKSGKWVEPGAPLRIKLKIIRRLERGEQIQFEEDISNPRLTSWGGNSLDAKLANVLLDPGIYRVSVENLNDAPEFQGAKVSLRIARAYVGK